MRINGIRRDELSRKGLWLVGSRGNCRGDECEASIYSEAYTEDSGPLGPRGEKTTVVIYCGNQV